MAEKPSDSGIPMWVCFVVTLAFAALISLLTWATTDKAWLDDCVKHGVAKWTVTNEHGKVEWDWIRPAAH